MNFSFHMGDSQAAINQIIQICKQYYQCDGCPVDRDGSLIIDNCKVFCSTKFIKDIMERAGKNV